MDSNTAETIATPLTSSHEANLNPVYLLRKSWEYFTSMWLTLVAIQVLSGLLSFIFVLLTLGIGMYLFFGVAQGKAENLLPLLPYLILLGGFALIILLLVYSIGNLALMIAVLQGYKKNGTVPSFKEALGRLIPFSFFSLAAGMLTAGAFLLFYIPGILFSLWFSISAYIFLVEKESVWNSLMKSRAYTKGHTIQVLIAFVGFFVIFTLINYLPALIPSIFGEDSFVSYVSYLFAIPLGFIAGPMQVIYGVMIYRELKQAAPQPVVLPSKVPYVATSLLGYAFFLILLGSIISVAIPRLSEFLQNRTQTMKEKPAGAEDTFYYSGAMSERNNMKRRKDVTMLLNAVSEYQRVNKKLPPGITSTSTEIASDGGVHLCTILVPDYIPEIPVDPSYGSESEGITDCSDYYETAYFISAVSKPGEEPVVTIRATHAEAGEEIVVSN